MKKAVTLAAIAGLSLASDFEDTELMSMPFKPTLPLVKNTQSIFHDDDLFGTSSSSSDSRSKLSIFNKKKGENGERTEHDDELMTVMEYLKAYPQLVSTPERQVLDVRTRVPIISVLPAEQPKTTEEDNKPKERSNYSIFDRKEYEKTAVNIKQQAKFPVTVVEIPKAEEEAENPNKPKRSNFSIFERKEGEKTNEENHHGKSATRSGFSILNRRHVTSGDSKRDLEALVSKLLRHKSAKSDNAFFGLRDLKKGDKDSNKANVLKLDSEEEGNELYGMRDWRRGDKDSNKAGVLGFDSEEDYELYGMKDWRRDRDNGKAGVLGLDSEEDDELYGMRDWRRGDKDSNKAGVLGFDDEGDNELGVLGGLIHDGLEVSRDVKNKNHEKIPSLFARDVMELKRKRNFLGN